jgi:hypothetical protein
MQCSSLNRQGKPCGAHTLSGRDKCIMHSDSNIAVQLGRRGGERRAVCQPVGLRDFNPPRTPQELRELISHVLIEIRNGQLQPRVGNSLAFLGATLIRAVDQCELAGRIERLEQQWESIRSGAKCTA